MRLLGTICFAFIILLNSESKAAYMSYEEMKIEYGNNKTFTPDVEAAAIIALSFFPELKNTSIRFEHKTIKTTMAARPELSSAFKGKRTYVVYINNSAELNGGVSFSKLNIKQRIGIVAHELAHILDYENREDFSVIACGLLYKCIPIYHKNLERSTDEMVINKGLGRELYEFSNYVIYNSNASEKYIAFKKRNYLLPEEIKSKLIIKN